MAIQTSSRVLDATPDQIVTMTVAEGNINVTIPTQQVMSDFPNVANTAVILYYLYPLLSIQNTNVSDYVVGIKMYDVNQTEVQVSSLTLPITIEYPMINNFSNCYYFNETAETLLTDGLVVVNLGTRLRCLTSHLTDFTIGNVPAGTVLNTSSNSWMVILLVILGIILIAVIIFLLLTMSKKTSPSDILVNEGNSKDIQMKKF